MMVMGNLLNEVSVLWRYYTIRLVKAARARPNPVQSAATPNRCQAPDHNNSGAKATCANVTTVAETNLAAASPTTPNDSVSGMMRTP